MNTRQSAIVELVTQNSRVDADKLAKMFDVSAMTIRRDLTELEENGLVVRTHGGAVASGRIRFLRRAFPRYSVSPEKRAIGKLAAKLVAPGQTIMVDRGTTALEVVTNIPHNAQITVVTSSLCVAQALFESSVDVILLGGYLSKDFPSLYGPMMESMLKSLHVDMLFVGCDGADSTDGLYAVDLHVAESQHTMMGRTDRVVVVTESPKFENKSFARYAQWNEIHTLVTDSKLSQTDRANLADLGVEVLVTSRKL